MDGAAADTIYIDKVSSDWQGLSLFVALSISYLLSPILMTLGCLCFCAIVTSGYYIITQSHDIAYAGGHTIIPNS